MYIVFNPGAYTHGQENISDITLPVMHVTFGIAVACHSALYSEDDLYVLLT